MRNNRDEAYWAKYYESGAAPEVPSNFAKYVIDKYATEGDSLVELGCGNGRDARFFAKMKLGVVAIDQCAPEIDAISDSSQNNPHYVTGDFTNLSDTDDGYDLVYSRFTLHSVDAEGQSRTLGWSHRNLSEDGLLCIETRGQKNELYRRGEPVYGEPDAFIYDQHYRRFVDFETFKKEIEAANFSILEASEQAGYAPFEDTDYHFIRVIAQKSV